MEHCLKIRKRINITLFRWIIVSVLVIFAALYLEIPLLTTVEDRTPLLEYMILCHILAVLIFMFLSLIILIAVGRRSELTGLSFMLSIHLFGYIGFTLYLVIRNFSLPNIGILLLGMVIAFLLSVIGWIASHLFYASAVNLRDLYRMNEAIMDFIFSFQNYTNSYNKQIQQYRESLAEYEKDIPSKYMELISMDDVEIPRYNIDDIHMFIFFIESEYPETIDRCLEKFEREQKERDKILEELKEMESSFKKL